MDCNYHPEEPLTISQFEVAKKTTGAHFREFLGRALRAESGENAIYRENPAEYDIEKDICCHLDLYRNDPGNPMAGQQLRTMRRFALRRYQFYLAAKIDRKLRDEFHVGRLWLAKDYTLPRVGLALSVGTLGVLGSSLHQRLDEAVKSGNGWVYASLLAAFLSVAPLIFYCNVREQIGGRAKSTVLRRTALATRISAIWTASFGLGQWALARAVPQWKMEFPQAVLTMLAVLDIGLVTQFFFARTSIADPL